MKANPDAIAAFRDKLKQQSIQGGIAADADSKKDPGFNPRRPHNQVLGAVGVQWEQDGKYYDIHGFEVDAPE